MSKSPVRVARVKGNQGEYGTVQYEAGQNGGLKPLIRVLLRELTRETRHWGDFPDLLRAHVGNAPVIALDLPGNGRLNAQPSPTRVEVMAAACREALQQRSLPPPYHLLAMSLGAMVALAWATAHAEELQGCVLINTSSRTLSPWFQRLKSHNAGRLLGLLLSNDPQAVEAIVLSLTARHPTHPPVDLLAQWVRWRIENPVSRLNELQTHPTAGHDLPLDDGAWVARVVGRWLGGQT